LQYEVVVVPFDVLVRRRESDTDRDPCPPDEEDDEVLDPALAMMWDPEAALLDASAEHGVIGAAAAVPEADAATMVRAKEVAIRARRTPVSDASTGRLLVGGVRAMFRAEEPLSCSAGCC
jgi:hypothetical protein